MSQCIYATVCTPANRTHVDAASMHGVLRGFSRHSMLSMSKPDHADCSQAANLLLELSALCCLHSCAGFANDFDRFGSHEVASFFNR
jgi:hypothetical protein